MDSHKSEPAKDPTTELSDKPKIDEAKKITCPPDFRNILKRFEETKDVVRVEKIPSSTDILPHSVGPSKVGQLGATEEKNIKTSEDFRAGVQEGNLIVFDDPKPVSETSCNVKADSVDLKEQELTDKNVKDSTEKNIGEKVTSKSSAESKDAGSDSYTVKASDIMPTTSEHFATNTVISGRDPRYKIMLIGKNVSQHPLSSAEDDRTTEELMGQMTETESSVIPGTEAIQEKTESVIIADDVPNPPQKPRKKYSLQELEQSFISALNMPAVNNPQIDVKSIAKLVVSKSLPAIKITHPSDLENENDALEFSEKIKDKKQAEIATETQISDAPKDMNLQSNTEGNIDDRSYEGKSSIGQSMSLEFDEQGCIHRNMAPVTEAPSGREQKPFFYISSSELPPELRYRATAVSDSSNTSPDQNCRVSQSCLCSKDLHGFIFLIGSCVAVLAFAVAALANHGNIPAHYETIGFTVSIISGIFGVLSFICYTILTCYSACTANRYQRLTDAESALPFIRAGQYENVVEESWSSEKDRAFRRQNAMPSTRTSEVSVRTVSERQALISKTEKIKKDVTELLDTYANIVSELGPVESIEMRALSNEDEKKTDNLQESPSSE